MRASKRPFTVAIVHHWMEFFRGGEAVLEQFGLLFPQAPISMLVFRRENLTPGLRRHDLRGSFLQQLPWLRFRFRWLLPLFPEIVRTMRVPKRTTFVLSSDASVIKGIPLPSDAVHVCYCHSPPRYIWGLEEAYLQSASRQVRGLRGLFAAILPRLRTFDHRKAQRVDRFIANSRCVQERILRCYGRSAVVIHPPVDVDAFDAMRPREDFLLVVSALVPYKRVDLAVEACSRLGKRLVVIGAGPEMDDLRRRAGSGVTFLGWQPNEVVRDHFERCRALLFPGIEDFGITPCEAQAAGAPVIAFGEGGALETVRAGVTGLFFQAQTVAALEQALREFDALPPFPSAACRANVEHLRPARFRQSIREFLQRDFPDLFRHDHWPAEMPPPAAADVTRLSLPSYPTSENRPDLPPAVPSAPAPGPERSSAWRLARTHFARHVAAGAAAGGTLLAVYLTLRPTGAIATIPWFPDALAAWADAHGRFRNGPAYALLTLPCLLVCLTAASRRTAVALLALIAALLEVTQLLIASRHFEAMDIAWSWVGIAATWAAVEAFYRRAPRSTTCAAD